MIVNILNRYFYFDSINHVQYAIFNGPKSSIGRQHAASCRSGHENTVCTSNRYLHIYIVLYISLLKSQSREILFMFLQLRTKSFVREMMSV